MATVNFEIGNKEFEVRFIRESGYPPTKNERGSSLIEYDVTIYKDNQPMMKKFNQKRRVFFKQEIEMDYKDSAIYQKPIYVSNTSVDYTR